MLKHLDAQLDALEKIVNSVDREALEELIQEMIETVKNGGKIIATALGKNVPICEKFIGTLISLGIPSYFLHTNSAVHGDLGAVSSKDLVLLLSKSGETEESVYLYEHLKNKKAKVYVLTYNAESTLARISDKKICLYLETEGDPWNLVPNNSTIGYLFILQAIAMELIDRLQVPLEVFKENHPGGAIGKKLKEIGDKK